MELSSNQDSRVCGEVVMVKLGVSTKAIAGFRLPFAGSNLIFFVQISDRLRFTR